MKTKPLQKGQEVFIQPPHGRCVVKDSDKVELVRSMLDHDTASQEKLFYIGFGTANSQVKAIKCFGAAAGVPLPPCPEIAQYAILNGYTDIFIIRTHYHRSVINEQLEDKMLHETLNLCKYAGFRLSDYIVMLPDRWYSHNIRYTYAKQWTEQKA